MKAPGADPRRIARTAGERRRGRASSRQQLILQVEYDDAGGFVADFISDLSHGGVRLNRQLTPGDELTLRISFLDLVQPVQIDAVVRWAHGPTADEGAASGVSFVDPPADVRRWIRDVLAAGRRMLEARLVAPCRVVLLEPQPFLREVYGQEVRNWAEIRQAPLDLVAVADPERWWRELARKASLLTIIDVDTFEDAGVELLRRVRGNASTWRLPVICVGAAGAMAPLVEQEDARLLCLRKPLAFGALMDTVHALASVGSAPPPGSDGPGQRRA